MFLALTEVLLIGTLLYVIVTQLIIPIWRGTPIFPILEKERVLNQQLQDVEQDVVEARIQDEVRARKKVIRHSSTRKER